MKLCFATNNPGKLKEIQQLLVGKFELISLQEAGCLEELPETSDTIEGNSFQKADYVWQNYKISCFADDTGLEVSALQGAPGVYSARYAGPNCNANDNMDLLLKNLNGKSDRSAQFRTCITLILDGKTHSFEGVAKGIISETRRGEKGFGYDPIFIPEGFDRSFAQMSLEEKNAVSHRGKAVRKLIEFLNSLSHQ